MQLTLNKQQKEAQAQILDFIKGDGEVFILTGAAGTGKTTLLKSVVEEIKKVEQKFIIEAPTNRAAKILRQKTGFVSETLHSLMYNLKEIHSGGMVVGHQFQMKDNVQINDTVFIVDEASMVGNEKMEEGEFRNDEGILDDLLRFVFDIGKNNKLIFVGDHFQLPPVNESFSPALSRNYLENKYEADLSDFELTEVHRQAKDSYVLKAAIAIRDDFNNPRVKAKLRLLDNYQETIKAFTSNLDSEDPSKVIYLAYRNKDVWELNNLIRQHIYKEDKKILNVGDFVMNNSRFEIEKEVFGPGEIGIIREIGPFEKKTFKFKVHGRKGAPINNEKKEAIFNLNFMDAVVEFISSSGVPVYVHRLIWLDTLDYRYKDASAAKKAISQSVQIYDKSEDALKNNKFYNSLNLKYGYAITVHKAQGGEWESVFLYPVYPWDNSRNNWLYTAVTRASKELYSFNS